jgi:RNA polymerase sigma-70 factor (ECF subfamily)
MDERSDAEVIAASLAAPDEFAVVFERHFAPIWRYLIRRLSPSDADEIAGEVFRIGFEQRDRFDPGHVSALPWLYGIAANLVLKHCRSAARGLRAMARHQAAELVEPGDDYANADTRLDAARLRAALVSALHSLPRQNRELVLLAAFGELSYAELAQATGLAEGTVKSRLSRSKAKLRERVTSLGKSTVGPPSGRLMENGHD